MLAISKAQESREGPDELRLAEALATTTTGKKMKVAIDSGRR
jgi:hypothetical protein